jgi:C-terminal processing protease CtpA/Prc
MLKDAAVLAAWGCLLIAPLMGQQSAPQYSIGVYLLGPNTSCPAGPVYVKSVTSGTPAADAGIHAGDQVLAVDGEAVKDLRDAAARISSASSGPVVLQLKRNGANLTLSVSRERSDAFLSLSGFRRLDDGRLVPSYLTDAQARETFQMQSDLEHAIQTGDSVNVFPGHYPADLSLYYPGFELFAWDHGQNVTVGGVENGPAEQSGVRSDDAIVSVNGIDPRGKSLAELEKLFSSSRPDTMHLVVNRFGEEKQFAFQLARASEVLNASGWRMFEGVKVPLWVPDAYARCFE